MKRKKIQGLCIIALFFASLTVSTLFTNTTMPTRITKDSNVEEKRRRISE